MKRVFSILWGLVLLVCAASVFAAEPVSGGIGTVAQNVTLNLPAVAGVIIAICYIAGLAFIVGGIVKLKAHKDTPTQVPISTGLVWCLLGALLLFLPTLISMVGKTLFGSSGSIVSITGNLITTIQ